MKLALPLYLAMFAACGCDGATAPANPIPAAKLQTAPPASPAAVVTDPVWKEAAAEPAAPARSAEEIFNVLTAHTWDSHRPSDPKPLGICDHSVTTFRDDGTWSVQEFSDYQIPLRTGTWNLQRNVSDWFLCRDDGLRQRVDLNPDGSLTLGFGKLHPDQPLERLPERTAATLPDITLPAEVQQIVKRLTAHHWKRANDLDLRREPTEVRFGRDWTYVASYRYGLCSSKGTWYATADEIVGHSPTGRCGGGGSYGDQLVLRVIDDRRILANHDLFVPADEPVKRGVIWNLFGFDVRMIRIEYDMPIRRGLPVRFDVTITNTSDKVLVLERFSIRRGFSNYGRDAGDEGKAIVLPPDELSGLDLKRAVLQPGQSHSFTLSAAFPDAGEQLWYFNAFISGATQNWDTHQAHELWVRE